MEKLKYVIIGCGRIAPCHITAYLNNIDRLNLIAICDLDKNKAKQFLSDNNIDVPIYTDYKQLLSDVSPDICAIATYSGYHSSIAIDCMEAGAHVICEKPLSLSTNDFELLKNHSLKSNKSIGVCFQNRFNISSQLIHKGIENNAFGRLLYGTIQVRWHRNKAYYEQDSWRGTWELDGGALMNQCIHGIDLLLWMMGSEPCEVFAYTDQLNHSYIEAEDIGLALIKFKNGTYGIIEGTTNITPTDLDESLCIYGDKGMVRASGIAANIIDTWITTENGDESSKMNKACFDASKNLYGTGHSPLYKNFLDSIENNSEPISDLEAGIKASSVILAIYKSAATGKPVKLPCQNCSTIDFKGRF